MCKKKQDLLLKTGKWFHGKETKTHNPTKEIEFHLLTTPSATPPIKTSPKIVKTGFPASSITKAQLGEQAEERRKQQQIQQQQQQKNAKINFDKHGSNLSLSRSISSSSDNSESSSSLSYKINGGSKKHVTFEQINSSQGDTASDSFNEMNNNDLSSLISDIPIDNSNNIKVSAIQREIKYMKDRCEINLS